MTYSRGLALACLSSVILSFTGILIGLLTRGHGMPPLVLAFWRNVLTSGLLFLVLGGLRPALLKIGRRSAGLVAASAVNLALFNAIWTVSVQHAGAALATVLVYSSCAFTVILSRALFNEELTSAKIGSVVLCLTGCAWIALPSSGVINQGVDGLGVLAGIASGITYSCYTLLGRSGTRRGLSPWGSMVYTFGGGAVILGLLNLLCPEWGGAGTVQGLLAPESGRAEWLLLLALAAGPTLLGFGLYNVSLTVLPSGTANLALSLEPVFTAIVAIVFLGEKLSARQGLGGVLIIAGVLLLGLRPTDPMRRYRSWKRGVGALTPPANSGSAPGYPPSRG